MLFTKYFSDKFFDFDIPEYSHNIYNYFFILLREDQENVPDSDLNSILDEIEKKFTPGKNVAHFKRLLLLSKSVRRPWIEQHSNGINDIIKKYPILNEYEMVRYLFT